MSSSTTSVGKKPNKWLIFLQLSMTFLPLILQAISSKGSDPTTVILDPAGSENNIRVKISSPSGESLIHHVDGLQ